MISHLQEDTPLINSVMHIHIVQWLILHVRIWVVQGSYLCWTNAYENWGLPYPFKENPRTNTQTRTRSFFHILSNLCFTNHHTISYL